jgi:L-histidine N-alpha-methyltransferase
MSEALAENLDISKDSEMKEDFLQDVLKGLSAAEKRLSSRFFYDTYGSKLFEKITQVSTYYPTRTEIDILETYAEDMAALIGPGATLIEFGSGSSRKTPILLHALESLQAYVPIDIAGDYLQESASSLAADFKNLNVIPVHGDFTSPIELPKKVPLENRVGFFPGSTIGNFDRAGAEQFLRNAGQTLGSNALMLIGIDLQKDISTLLHAYDDPEGVTAAFNKNILKRINKELGGTFDLSKFAHESRYNMSEGRVEMHLVSTEAQSVKVQGQVFHFEKDENIHTENSYKYTLKGFKALAEKACWSVEKVWLDECQLFSMHAIRFKG